MRANVLPFILFVLFAVKLPFLPVEAIFPAKLGVVVRIHKPSVINRRAMPGFDAVLIAVYPARIHVHSFKEVINVYLCSAFFAGKIIDIV